MKKIIMIILFLGCVFTVSSCTQQAEINIGFSGNLTGNNSEIGVEGRDGLLLAIEKINSDGGVNGKKLNLIIRDDESNPETALQNDQAFYEEGVSFIIGHMISSMGSAVLPFINESDILMISPTMSSYSFVGKDDHLVSVVSSNEVEADFIIETILKQPDIKKVAIIHDTQNQTYTGVLKNLITDGLLEKDVLVTLEVPFASGNDVAYFELASQVQNSDTDAIVLLSSSLDTAMFCQQFYKLGNQRSIFINAWAMNNDLLLQGGEAVEGINMPSLYDTEASSPEYLEFRQDYLDAYGREPSFPALYSYEAGLILSQAMEEADSFEPEKVQEKIIEIGIFEGLQGEISINEYGDAKRTLFHYTIQNGQYVKVQ